MIILTKEVKSNIRNMKDDAKKYCSFPDSINIEKFMKTE